MSIKKLFDSTNKNKNYLSDTNSKDAFKKIESEHNATELSVKKESFLPPVDFSKPKNFAKYGSAYLYYKGAMERIYDYYPYDGSDAEINKFYNELLDVEKHIFNYEYPRTNGYAVISADGWGTLSSDMTGGYGTPATLEYIDFFGGPHSSSYTKLADAFPTDLNSKREYSNLYQESLYVSGGLPSDYGSGTRQSNLKSNFDTGVTVEFWLKKEAFNNAKTQKEVVFDMWNNAVSSSATYGRLRVELTGASSGSPFLVTAQSSSSGIFQQSIGQNLTTASLESFSHYAFTYYNSGSNLITELYVNGILNDTNTTSGALSELNSSGLAGRIGALITSSVDNGGNRFGSPGGGKLSASLDEFRFWKVKRNAEDIGLNWKTHVRGGSNTDISNTTLGVYFKFNEGITTDSTTDSKVLDYSGRLSNGTWTGYGSNSRTTSSALVEAGARTTEYLDPIIYSDHPDVSSLQTRLLKEGENHDLENNSSFINMMPQWMADEQYEKDDDLHLLTHIMGTYFDKLHLQIESLPKIRNKTYPSASVKPTPFAKNMVQSLGLYTPDLYIDSDVIENFLNRTEDTFMESDLNEAKNLIYLNLYNNIAGIYKSKGTEKSIKNTLRCFNIDDRIVKFKTYSDNNTFTLDNNLKDVLERNSSLNFNTSSNTSAVVYQFADATNPESFGFISGSYEDNKEDRHGFTVEANIIFPNFEQHKSKVNRNFVTSSLFGAVLPNTASASDLTAQSPDTVNFQVYAVRPEEHSKNVYFLLTSSVAPHPFTTLTSSLFFDVYDNTQWNFSIRLKPSNYPLTDIVSGSDSHAYDLEFRGINAIGDNIQNSFLLTSSIATAVGKNFLKKAKRLYAGARRTNITGTVQHKTDVLFTNLKYWAKYIDSTNIDQHLFAINNAGVSGSFMNISPLDSLLKDKDITNSNTLALHWTFDNLPTTVPTASVYANDMSSGSAEIRDNYGWVGGIAGYQYNGIGFGFSGPVAEKRDINTLKFINPELPDSSDMVKILDNEKELYKEFSLEPPVRYFHTIEKSMYDVVSEEMLTFFAGVIDFNNLIGAPVNRYRDRYKGLEKLREIFFRKVTKVSKVEKFLKYYRWLDDSIGAVIEQLIPASGDPNADVYNIVESHVLERNKYQSRFPHLTSYSSTEGPAMGINKNLYNWKFGHAPLSNSQSDNILWWKERAIRGVNSEASSGNSAIDSQREIFRETIDKVNDQSASVLTKIDNTRYDASVDVLRKRATPYRFETHRNNTFKGGVNFNDGKDIGFTYNAVAPAGPVNTSGGVFVPENVLLALLEDMSDIAPITNDVLDPNAKTKRHLKVLFGRQYEEGLGYYNVKSSKAFPFNVFSSSITNGYNAAVVEGTSASIEITNLHNDVYGSDMEKPMQGPFTEYAVGGHQSRHVAINKGSDDATTRPEAWKILLGFSNSSGIDGAIGLVGPDYPDSDVDYAGYPSGSSYPITSSQKAVYYRDFTAKRPVNIRNILMKTGSTILGNYEQNYQVVHSVGGFSNPRAFIDNQPDLPLQITRTPSSSQARSILDVRRKNEGHFEFIPEYNISYLHSNTKNKSIIRSRFSAPGSVEVLGQGYGDIRSNDFSVYNCITYRNLSVRKPFQSMNSVSEDDGIATPGIRTRDQNNKDFGLMRNLATHAGRFGRDELVSDPGASIDQNAAFHKVNRNPLKIITQDSSGNFVSSSQKDNFFVQHAIPRSDRQYAWITGSLAQEALGKNLRYYGYAPTTGPQAGYHATGSGTSRRYVSFFDFVTSSMASVGELFQPSNDLNIYVVDPIDAFNDNNLGLALTVDNLSYYNDDLLGTLTGSQERNADYFNLLMTKRKNTFGFRGVPNTSPVNHPVLRKHRNDNIFSFATSPLQRFSNFKPITKRGKPATFNYDINSVDGNGNVTQSENLSFETVYNNENIYFSDSELNQKIIPNGVEENSTLRKIIGMKDQEQFNLNWVYYSERMFPTKLREFTTGSSTRIGYDNLYWRDEQQDRFNLHSNSIIRNSFGNIVSQSSWPLDAPIGFLTRSFTGLGFIGSANNNLLRHSNSAGELQNAYTHAYKAAAPIGVGTISQNITVGALYSRKHMLGGRLSVVSPAGIDIPETGSLSVFADSETMGMNAGEALWEAGTLAGYINKSGTVDLFVSSASEPWFNDYDSFKRDLLFLAKDEAVIPEFRISEHIEDYEKLGINANNKFNTFEIVGTVKNSSDSNFYKDFSNSEFMSGFVDVGEDVGLNAGEVKLVCNATIRFNPYKGFYPAQRTIDLVEQFRKSYGESIQGKSGEITAPEARTGTGRPLAQTLFAPGILYNTIKSGMAVDYPIVTSVSKLKKTFFGAVSGTTGGAAWMLTPDDSSLAGPSGYRGGEFWDYRIPFDAIIEPEKFISNLNFYDSEPNPSASLDATSSFSPTNVDAIYTKMASNFFGEVSKFFLKDSSYTKLESNTIDDIKFGVDEVYGARIKLRRSMSGSRTYLLESGSSGNNVAYGASGARFYNSSTKTFVSGSEFQLPQHPRKMPKGQLRESFTLYSRPTAFGPPVAGRPSGVAAVSSSVDKSTPVDSINGLNPAFTPPYYDGEAWVDLIFRPTPSVSYDIQRILSEVETVSWRFDSGISSSVAPSSSVTSFVHTQIIPTFSGNIASNGDFIYDGKNINVNCMQLTHSINVFGVERVNKEQKDSFGNSILTENESVGSRWVIEPKFETPMPNFSDSGIRGISSANSTLSIPTYSSASVPRGMWHQFGIIEPDPKKGIFLEIEDIPNSWLKYHYDVVDNNSPYNNQNALSSGSLIHKNMKSLVDVFGFNKTSERLGQFKNKTVLKEAIVAVPYQSMAVETETKTYNSQTKSFFGLDRSIIDSCLSTAVGSADGDSLDFAGESIRNLVTVMQEYVLPPQFDFLNNQDIDPMSMYFFEFEYELDSDDLNYIWQNLAPIDYKKITKESISVAHKLGENELLTKEQFVNENTRWMIFKVKQRGQSLYKDTITSQVGQAKSNKQEESSVSNYPTEFNWPYDYVSFVETITFDTEALYKDEVKSDQE